MSQISNNFDYFANDLGLNLNNYAINYDFKRNRNIIQAARLTGNTPGDPAGDGFGISTSLNSDGNVLAVGANTADTSNVGAGAVYIFTGNANSWAQAARLTGNTLGNPAGDRFGISTSLNSAGNVLAVGANLADTDGVNLAGAVYLFTGNGNSWAQAARLTGNTLGLGAPINDFFGLSTSLNSAGNVLSVGAYSADTNGVGSAGAVYIFTGNGNSWAQTARLTGNTPGNPAGDFFGYSTSLNSAGNVLSVGARDADTTGVTAGAVYIFTGDGNSWAQTARLTGNTLGLGDPSSDLFGLSTSLNSAGNVLSVGAYSADTDGVGFAGAVYIFTGNGNSWAQAARLTGNTPGNPAGDFFGFSTSLNSAGNILSVGAYSADTDGVGFAGAVYIFTGDGNSWAQTARLTGNTLGLGDPSSDLFGFSTSLNSAGNVLSVGANFADTNGVNAGAVYLFDINSYIKNLSVFSGFYSGEIKNDQAINLLQNNEIIEFNGSNYLEVKNTTGLKNDYFTIYCAYERSSGEEAVLFSSLHSIDNINYSGFNFGITRYNNYYYEYYDLADGPKVYISSKKADTKGIVALTKNVTTININNYDATEEIFQFESFETVSDTDKQNKFLIGSCDTYPFFSGKNFIGKINSLIYLNESLNSTYLNDAADGFIYDINKHITLENIEEIYNFTGFEGNITGGFFDTTSGNLLNCLNNYSFYDYPGFVSGVISGLITGGIHTATGYFTGFIAQTFNYTKDVERFFSNIVITGTNTGYELFISGTGYTGYVNINAGEIVNICGTGSPIYFISGLGNETLSGLVVTGVDQLTGLVTGIQLLKNQSFLETINFPFSGNINSLFNSFVNTGNYTYKFTLENNGTYVTKNEQIKFSNTYLTGVEISKTTNLLINKFTTKDKNINYLNSIGIDEVVFNKKLDSEDVIEVYAFDFNQDYSPIINENEKINTINNTFRIFDNKNISAIYNNGLLGVNKIEIPSNFNYSIDSIDRISGNYDLDDLVLIDFIKTGFSVYYYNGTGYMLYPDHKDFLYSYGKKLISGIDYFQSGDNKTYIITGLIITLPSQLARLTGNTLGLGNPGSDRLGTDIALNSAGNVLSVGAYSADTNGVGSAGAVYIFTGNGNSWAQTARLTGNTPGNPAGDFFGYSTSLNSAGNVLSVGARDADTTGVTAGAVYIFTGDGNSWAQTARLTGNTLGLGDPSSDLFGLSTSLNSAGNVLAVGAHNADTSGVTAGAVYIFTGNGNSWAQAVRLTGNTLGLGAPANANFGISTSLNSAGNILSVGAYSADTDGVGFAGAVYIFTGDGNSWAQAARLTGNTLGLGNPASDRFGISTSLNSDGNVLSVGAYNADTNGISVGAVYLFTGNGNSWAQAARLTGNTLGLGAPANANFGVSTSLNSEGNLLSVGAFNAETKGAASAGAVYLFTGNGNSWTQLVRLTGNTLGLGNPALDTFGNSVALNSAGNVLSVGAYNADTTGVTAGAVYIFDGLSIKEKEKILDGYIYGYNSILDYKLISGNTYTLNLPKKYSRDSISVYLNGIKQIPITDYIEKSLFDKIFNPVFIENLGKNIYNTNDALDVNK